MKLLGCEDIWPLTEYVGCIIEQNYSNMYIHFAQPVMIQSFTDEFSERKKESKRVTPAYYGTVLFNTE